MTSDWVHLPYDFLSKVSNDIINKVHGVNRVVYDISSKPPATIEWNKYIFYFIVFCLCSTTNAQRDTIFINNQFYVKYVVKYGETIDIFCQT